MSCNERWKQFGNISNTRFDFDRVIKIIQENSTLNFSGDPTFSANVLIGQNLTVNGTTNLLGDVSMACGLINDVSAITFCDGTYLGPGNSFDISTNKVLHLKSSENILVDGDTTFNDTVKIMGKLKVLGETIKTDELVVKDPKITLNQVLNADGTINANGTLDSPNNFQSGIVIYRGPANINGSVRPPFQLLYDESSNRFEIGEEGDLQPVATRDDEPIDNGVAVWSIDKFVTDRGFFADSSGNVEISGDLVVNGGFTITNISINNLDVSNNLQVEGQTTLSDVSLVNVDVSNDLQVEGQTTLIDVSVNKLDVSNDLQVEGQTTLSDVSVNKLDVSSDLRVDGQTTLADVSLVNVDVCGNITFDCGLINDVSAINFCDGTYIGPGSSFDISTNEVLHLKSNQNIILESSSQVEVTNDISATNFITSQGIELNDIGDRITILENSSNTNNFEGSNYIFVYANGTQTQNGNELKDAYEQAKTMSPSSNNKITIIATPGKYQFSQDFEMDREHINLVSLDGNRSIKFLTKTIFVNANNVFVKGIDVGNLTFKIGNQLDNLEIHNCKGVGDNSFSSTSGVKTHGKFIDCEGGKGAFGAVNQDISGTFINCIAGNVSFGLAFDSSITINGEFTNCNAKEESFGFLPAQGSIIINGTYTNCTALENSFGFSGENNYTNLTNNGVYKFCTQKQGTLGDLSLNGVRFAFIVGNDFITKQNTIGIIID